MPRYATVDLTGRRVDEVVSRGKHLFIRVGQASIHSHLKMDGSWRVSGTDRPSRAGHRIRIILEAGDVQAAGIDLGVLEILDREHDEDTVAHLGPDLLGDDWDPQTAAANLVADPDRPLAEALLDQRVMARRRQCVLQRVVLRHRSPAHHIGEQPDRPAADGAAGTGHVVAQQVSLESNHHW